jgi:toxin-antitoxin system PIN domain toxin
VSATVDANLLLYASDSTNPHHRAAQTQLQKLAAGPDLFYLFWPVIMAYLRIATHPSIFSNPLDPATARANIDRLITRKHVRCPGEQPGFWSIYEETTDGDVIRGNLVPDAHIAALMKQHEVRTIWTADRDFRRFHGITSRNPLDEESSG